MVDHVRETDTQNLARTPNTVYGKQKTWHTQEYQNSVHYSRQQGIKRREKRSIFK